MPTRERMLAIREVELIEQHKKAIRDLSDMIPRIMHVEIISRRRVKEGVLVCKEYDKIIKLIEKQKQTILNKK